MATDDENLKRLTFALGGAALGALLLNKHHEEARKSRTEQDDPDGVEALGVAVGEILEEWRPPSYEREDEYSDDLCEFLSERLPETLSAAEDDEDDGDSEGDDEFEGADDEGEDLVVCRPSTPYGTPDILIDDRLALELKINPNKSERDRLVGQCCGYSREWVTWAIVIDMPPDRVRELEELLDAKSLHYIEVIAFA